jgi:PAS domain S-box-containing protein
MPVRSDRSAPLQYLEQLVALSPIAIANTDSRHRIRYCNPAFEKLFGYRASEALGRKLELVVGFERDRGVAAALRRAREGRRIHLRTRARRKDQSTLEVEFHGVPATPNEMVSGLWALFQDVTERYNVEQQLRGSIKDAEAMLSKVTRTMIHAQESERLRIARELHDDVGQRLALWQLGMDRLKRELHAAPRDITARMDDLRKQATRISDDLQALSRELYSPVLSLLPIDQALNRLCEEMSTRFGIAVGFASRHVSVSVPAEVSLCLFRVLQEMLTNTASHSEPRRVSVTLTGAADTIHLAIRDFGWARTDEIKGDLLLVKMRERVAMVKGTFAIASPPDGGTEIDIRIPLSREQRPFSAD